MLPIHNAPPLREIFTNASTRLHLALLVSHASSSGVTAVVGGAIGVAELTFSLKDMGYETRIQHRDGLSEPIRHAEVLTRFNKAYGQLQQDQSVFVGVTHETSRSLRGLAQRLNTNDIHAAAGFALAFAETCTAQMREYKSWDADSFSRIVLTQRGMPDEGPYIRVKGHPFEVEAGDPVPCAPTCTVRGEVLRQQSQAMALARY